MTLDERKVPRRRDAALDDRHDALSPHGRPSTRNFGARPLNAGDKVVLWYASANFDEEHFAAPTSFIPTRSPNDHVAFGLHSPHLCLGRAPRPPRDARPVRRDRPTLESSVELVAEPERLRSNFISGIKNLPIRVTWR